jgi:hypothetical protein
VKSEQKQKTLRERIEALTRRALQPSVRSSTRNGVPLLPVRAKGVPVTPELVNQLRNELS